MTMLHALRPDFSPHSDAEAARVAVDEHGIILHATAAFAQLCGAPIASKRANLLDILHFDDPDSAFRSPAVAGEPTLYSLQAGLHGVYFDQSGLTAQLQFDWMVLPDSRRILVASADMEQPSEDALREWLQPAQEASVPVANFFAKDVFQDLSRDAMLIIDELGIIVDCNDQFLRDLDIPDPQGRAFMDLVHEQDKSAVRTVLGDLMRGPAERRAITFECQIKTEDQPLRIEWRCRMIDGNYYLLGRDVTEFRYIQTTLTHQQQQLREAEAIGRIGHWHWKLGQDTIDFSDEMFRIFGASAGSFSPNLDIVNEFVHRRDIGRMMRAFQRAIIEAQEHDIDFRIRRADGTFCHVRCRGRCKLDSDGDVIALFGIMQDISDRIAHETALRRAKEEAEHAYATKSQFLANMSHELRTPLNAIIGFSEILENQLFGPLGNEKYVDYTKGIRESGEHLLDLITDILDMSKIEAGQYKLALEKVSIDKIIHTAVHMMEGRALENRIKISLSMDKNPRAVTADKRALMQIMLNILSNAVKFSHENGHVQVQHLERPDYFSIRISDEGIGIPANKIPYIGRPFEQVSNQYNRSHEGSGLGLAISKELIALHGGNLHIDSTQGKGTVVTIKLPYSPPLAE